MTSYAEQRAAERDAYEDAQAPVTEAIALLDSLYANGDLSVDQHTGVMRGFERLQGENATLRAALTKLARPDERFDWLEEHRAAGDDLNEMDWVTHVAREALG